MHGFGHAYGFAILQVPGNKADAVPREHLRTIDAFLYVAMEAALNTLEIVKNITLSSSTNPES